MNKYVIAIALSILPSYGNAVTEQEGCQVLATHIQVFALAKQYGMPYESALGWIANLTYVEPWSELLATTVTELYSIEYDIPVDQLGILTYAACLETFGVK